MAILEYNCCYKQLYRMTCVDQTARHIKTRLDITCIVCPRSSDSIYIVTFNMKTSWTDSNWHTAKAVPGAHVHETYAPEQHTAKAVPGEGSPCA